MGIPVLGKLIVNFLWGGFAVDNPTLNRFLSLHFLLPFVLAGLSLLHLVLLHTDGNNNPLGISSKFHFIYFYPYFYVKDLFAVFSYLFMYLVFVIFLCLLPWLTPKLVIKSSVFRPITRILFWFIFVDFILLGWIGQNVAEYPFIEIGQFLTLFYFAYFIIILPALSYFEYIFCVEAIKQ